MDGNNKSNILSSTVFPVFVKDPNSEDNLKLIRKLFLSTTLNDYKKIDPLVIYLNIFNIIKPNIIHDTFGTLLEDYNYKTKYLDFDDLMKSKFKSTKIYFSKADECVCIDFEELSEYEDLTTQHMLCLFGIITCFIGWKIEDPVKFEKLVKILMSRFCMASSANQQNESYWNLKPSLPFAIGLHESIALTRFRPQIVKQIEEIVNESTKITSISLGFTWEILAGAGLNDLIIVCWHIKNHPQKLQKYDTPKNTLSYIVSALKKYKAVGPYCILLNDNEIEEFKNISTVRQYLENPHVMNFSVCDIRPSPKKSGSTALLNAKEKCDKLRNLKNDVSNITVDSGKINLGDKSKIGEKNSTNSSGGQSAPAGFIWPNQTAQSVPDKCGSGQGSASIFPPKSETKKSSSLGSSLFGTTGVTTNQSAFNFSGDKFGNNTSKPEPKTSVQSSGKIDINVFLPKTKADNCDSAPNKTKVTFNVPATDNSETMEIDSKADLPHPEESNMPSEEGLVPSDCANNDVDELAEYTSLIDEIIAVKDYNNWFVQYDPVTVTPLNTSYY